MAEPTCTKCPEEAVFDTPEKLCKQHWAEWWIAGLEIADPGEREKELADLLQQIG